MTCVGRSCWSPDPQQSSGGLFEVGAPWTGRPPWPWLQLREGSGGRVPVSRPPEGCPALSLPSQTELRPDTECRGRGFVLWGEESGFALGWFGLGAEGTLLRDID